MELVILGIISVGIFSAGVVIGYTIGYERGRTHD